MIVRLISTFRCLSLFLLLAAFPRSSSALSCAVPAHQIVMLCENGACAQGIRVYQLRTAFPCEFRPIVENAQAFHSSLIERFFSLSQDGVPDGVYEVSFTSCDKQTVESIPWDELETKSRTWTPETFDDADWQMRKTQRLITIIERDTGCTLSLAFDKKGESKEYLKSRESEYRWEQRTSLLEYYFRLWILPLLIIPAIAVALLLATLQIIKREDAGPKDIAMVLIPIALQVYLFSYVIGPATDIWLGPYRLIFFVTSAMFFVIWLMQLLWLWKWISDYVDQFENKPEEDASDSSED